ncbi:hypothetical protein JOE65_002081 [Arthrobacter roseus]|nr:hypothetical protein [Arthrobacter roseus]
MYLISCRGYLATTVGVYDVNADVLATGECRHDSSQCAGCAALPADDSAQIFLVNADLEGFSPTVVLGGYLDIIRAINDSTDQVFECF